MPKRKPNAMLDGLVSNLCNLTGSDFQVGRHQKDGHRLYSLYARNAAGGHLFWGNGLTYQQLLLNVATLTDMVQMGFIPCTPGPRFQRGDVVTWGRCAHAAKVLADDANGFSVDFGNQKYDVFHGTRRPPGLMLLPPETPLGVIDPPLT